MTNHVRALCEIVDHVCDLCEVVDCVFDLCEVADLAIQFTLHSVDRALELDQLSVQEAGVVFVFREFQYYITCRGGANSHM